MCSITFRNKLDRERKDVIENINYILKKIQEKGLDIGILLENSASTNCFGSSLADLMDILNSIDQELRYRNKNKTRKRIAICQDTQHYWAAGQGKSVHEYQNTLDMYGHEIMLAHINNNPQEAIFGRGMDKHAHILDPIATLMQDVFKL